MRSDKNWLRDIVKATGEIAFLIQGLDESSFLINRAIRGATQLQLLYIGEAAVQLTDQFKQNHPSIAWKPIANSRNIGIHAYFNTNWLTVWVAASTKIPALRLEVLKIIATEFTP